MMGLMMTSCQKDDIDPVPEDDVVSVPEDAINSLFTINKDGQQVYFSKGNLQYINSEWHFAEHQYDYLGTYSVTACDLFSWSTPSNFYGMLISINDTDHVGDFVDWGNAIGDGHTWRTLTAKEWNYVIHRDDKSASATVCGKHGIILLPDEWTLPDNVTCNTGLHGWGYNKYDTAEWALMEAAGAVFLPAAGTVYQPTEGSYELKMLFVGSYGDYWSSTPCGEDGAYILTFEGGEVIDGGLYGYTDEYRGNGMSVRLVQDAN